MNMAFDLQPSPPGLRSLMRHLVRLHRAATEPGVSNPNMAPSPFSHLGRSPRSFHGAGDDGPQAVFTSTTPGSHNIAMDGRPIELGLGQGLGVGVAPSSPPQAAAQARHTGTFLAGVAAEYVNEARFAGKGGVVVFR